jgi:hypothetical protein
VLDHFVTDRSSDEHAEWFEIEFNPKRFLFTVRASPDRNRYTEWRSSRKDGGCFWARRTLYRWF